MSADEIVAQVVELLLRQLIAAQTCQQHRNAGSVVLEYERWKDAGRQYAHDLLRLGIHLSDRRLDRHIGMEVEPRHGYASKRHGFEVLDSVHSCGERPLSHRHDSILHLGRGEPGEGPDDVDDRNIDAREDVYRHRHDGQDAQDRD